MKIKEKLFLIAFAFTVLATSCSHESVTTNELPIVSFSSEVLPILQTGCAISGCHDASSAESDKIYDNYQNIMHSIKPGDPEGSKAYKAMTNYYQIMPPKNPLSVEDRTKIRVWILQGALNN